MADQELLKRLKRSVHDWNEWRRNNPDEIHLNGAHLEGASLSGANLSGAHLLSANLSGASLDGANLSSAYLHRADLDETDLSGADLSMAHLSNADLFNTKLHRANLRQASLNAATLTGADFRYADLSGADFTFTIFNSTDLTGANFNLARMGDTSFNNVDLSVAECLEEVRHEWESYISIDTVYRSKGNIPFEFLRGIGVPDNFIEYMHSLTGTAFEYYSCFISYSTKDQEFAERLHGDLQNKGVRCWFAPHDAKAGQKLDLQIDRAIRLHEKVLLILSPDSIQSDWVKREIKKAAKRQSHEKKDVLFPVSLVLFKDLQEWEYWDGDLSRDLAAEIREYLIPDFSDWKNHDAYKKAFNKLLKDLQSGKTKNRRP